MRLINRKKRLPVFFLSFVLGSDREPVCKGGLGADALTAVLLSGASLDSAGVRAAVFTADIVVAERGSDARCPQG